MVLEMAARREKGAKPIMSKCPGLLSHLPRSQSKLAAMCAVLVNTFSQQLHRPCVLGVLYP